MRTRLLPTSAINTCLTDIEDLANTGGHAYTLVVRADEVPAAIPTPKTRKEADGTYGGAI